MRRCIKRWQETGRIDDKESISRSAKKTKITKQQLSNLDRIIDKNPDLYSEKAMNRIPGLKVYVRTVRRYLIRHGWKVIRIFKLTRVVWMDKWSNKPMVLYSSIKRKF